MPDAADADAIVPSAPDAPDAPDANAIVPHAPNATNADASDADASDADASDALLHAPNANADLPANGDASATSDAGKGAGRSDYRPTGDDGWRRRSSPDVELPESILLRRSELYIVFVALLCVMKDLLAQSE